MRWKPHVRFGGRARETYQPRGWHRALVRSHWFAAGLTLVRRELQRREPRGHVTPAFEPELFRSRFALLRRADTMSPSARGARGTVRSPSPHRRRLAGATGALRPLRRRDRAGALASLDRFCDLYATGEIPEFHDVVGTVIAWSS